MEWSSLSETENKAFKDLRETGWDACSAETYHFQADGEKHIKFHVDVIGGGSDERYDALRDGLGKRAGFTAFASIKPRRLHASSFAPLRCASVISTYITRGKTRVCTKRIHARARSGSYEAYAD